MDGRMIGDADDECAAEVLLIAINVMVATNSQL
jgi:hypothetical protein